ncbi:hypothetical protein BD770DRAFT_375951 [Pilaira anomala]|nr:hypothetical protein BD770DRAFT_375951 [Pilaira anomala]
MNNRHSQLVLISKRVEKANEQINQIIEKLGWTRQELKAWQNSQHQLVTCPLNKRHRVSKDKIKQHYTRCLLKSRGAKLVKNTQQVPSSLFFYKKASGVVSFIEDDDRNKNRMNTVITELEPAPSNTTLEKRQAYDQVIQQSNRLRHDRTKLVLSDEIDRQVLENQKKKRLLDSQQQSKRSKKYRIKMKMNTPTEIQRELINAYMEQFK